MMTTLHTGLTVNPAFKGVLPKNVLQRQVGSGDNTFATARNLGVLSHSSTASTFRARGSIGKSDRIDICKLTVAAGAASASSTQFFKVQKGTIRTSLYIDYGLGSQLLFQSRVRQGTYSFGNGGFGALPVPITLYIQFDRPTQDTQYQYRVAFQP